MMKKLFKSKLVVLAVILLLSGGGFYAYKAIKTKPSPTQYITAAVAKGTLAVSISGTGQVSNSNQVDIKPEISGKITRLAMQNGQEIIADAILAQIDASEAQKMVRDAEVNLASARLALEKLQKPTDALSLLQAENSLENAKVSLEKLKLTQQSSYQEATDAKQKAEDAITKSYEDAYNTVADAFLDLPTIISKLQEVLYGYTIGQNEAGISTVANNSSAMVNSLVAAYQPQMQTFFNSAQSDYQTSRAKFDKNFTDYKNSSRYSDRDAIEALLAKTLETTKSIAQTAKSSSNALDTWVDFRTQSNVAIFNTVKTMQTNLSTYTSQVNSHLSALLSIQRTLQDNKDTITNSTRDLQDMEQNNPLDLAAASQSIKEKEASLIKLKAGTDTLDLQSQQLALKQKENALLDARQKLADYTIRAPMAGVITGVSVKIGDPASSGTALATLVTKQKIAEISLNEIDAAKVKVGQKATLTFDAVAGLNITGVVAEIDTLGTVSQGVVSYNVKIIFDTQDERIKSGMSVSAIVITDIKQDVLIAPLSAIKNQGENYFVELFDQNNSAVVPRQQMVETGLSNDTDTEIISGLAEGDLIVTRTITPTSQNTTQSAPSLFGSMGNRATSGGGGTVRAIPRND
ncbi:MAG: efflux RND transporter periplasmic adaptor subunit [Candidatus Komeilibacteria bacterium]|nr:efflux RND transporter periplasmic adaptor subunit [Candidatus Komeilibacteria bacterium]